MAFSKPSAHRCMILKLSRLLSREDVSELLFLSEDFIPQHEVEQIFSGAMLRQLVLQITTLDLLVRELHHPVTRLLLVGTLPLRMTCH